MVNTNWQPQSHGWYSILAYFLRNLELKLLCKWWSIVLVEQDQYEWALSSSYTILRAAQKLLSTFTGSNIRLPSPEPIVWRANSPVWCRSSQLTALQQTNQPQNPIHDVASLNPSCVTYQTEDLALLSIIPKLTNVGV